MSFFSVLAEVPPGVWAGFSGGLGGVGTWIIGLRQIRLSLERAQNLRNEALAADESAERRAFRASLMADLSALRALMKECDQEREALRSRVHASEEQILVLKASNEIMQRWLTFFKQRSALDTRLSPVGLSSDAASQAETPSASSAGAVRFDTARPVASAAACRSSSPDPLPSSRRPLRA